MLKRWMRALLIAVAIGSAACGDGGDGGDGAANGGTGTDTTEVPGTSTTAAGASRANLAVAKTPLGDVVVDSAGLTLYLFTRDSGGRSVCSGQCAQTWPPATVTSEPTAGAGVDASKLGTITRDDGARQLTYGGHPLYRFASDQAPGETKGQGVGGVWFVVSPAGEAVTTTAG